MDRRALIAIGILAGAAFGLYLFRNGSLGVSGGKGDKFVPPEPDQGPAKAAMANYTVPPNIGLQPNQPGSVFTSTSQTYPYPYNT